MENLEKPIVKVGPKYLRIERGVPYEVRTCYAEDGTVVGRLTEVADPEGVRFHVVCGKDGMTGQPYDSCVEAEKVRDRLDSIRHGALPCGPHRVEARFYDPEVRPEEPSYWGAP